MAPREPRARSAGESASDGLDVDVAVVGAGFGGLAAALTLARGGLRVSLHERLRYPGGCASTFERGGVRYEAGATLFGGFGEGQLFRRWIDELALDVRFVPLDPLVTLRTERGELEVPPSREALVARLASLEGTTLEAPLGRALAAFFGEQRRVADALWALFDDPTLLPPFGVDALVRHVGRSLRYAPVLRVLGRPLRDVVVRHGLGDAKALGAYLDAVCQITVQASAAEAEAPFAMGAMDYYFRGTGHVQGGIGRLAEALASAAAEQGAVVRFADEVRTVERSTGGARAGFTLGTRRGVVRARRVVMNLVPADARRVLAEGTLASSERASLDALDARVREGWGAVMLYLRLDPAKLGHRSPHHLELVDGLDEAFVEGNHVFVSIGGDDEASTGRDGVRTRSATVSTHVAARALAELSEEERGVRVGQIQARMAQTIARRAPEVHAAIVHAMPGSPRTFARFVGREAGLVGGVPRRAGLANYRILGVVEPSRDVFLVGDSVFPGQSTLGVALSGLKVAEQILARR